MLIQISKLESCANLSPVLLLTLGELLILLKKVIDVSDAISVCIKMIATINEELLLNGTVLSRAIMEYIC